MSKNFLWASLLAVLILTSCASRKSFVYLQDMQMGTKYPIETKYEAVIHDDDRLSITVSSKNPELAIPFNINGGAVQVGTDGKSRRPSGLRKTKVFFNSLAHRTTWLRSDLSGMTVNAAKQLIRDKIIAGNYISDPIVSIEFLNFKYTVLGAVGHNGTFTANGDRVTLIEAIANAGDLTAKAQTNRVAVIREVNGDRQMFMHDLTSKDIFESPCFYLQQNDIVYVEPKYRKKDTEDRGWQIGTTILSAITAVCSILWAIK